MLVFFLELLLWWLLLSTHISSPRAYPPRGIPCRTWESTTHPRPHDRGASQLLGAFPFVALVGTDVFVPTDGVTILFPASTVSTHNSNGSTDDGGFAELVYAVFLAHSTVTGSSQWMNDRRKERTGCSHWGRWCENYRECVRLVSFLRNLRNGGTHSDEGENSSHFCGCFCFLGVVQDCALGLLPASPTSPCPDFKQYPTWLIPKLLPIVLAKYNRSVLFLLFLKKLTLSPRKHKEGAKKIEKKCIVK